MLCVRKGGRRSAGLRAATAFLRLLMIAVLGEGAEVVHESSEEPGLCMIRVAFFWATVFTHKWGCFGPSSRCAGLSMVFLSSRCAGLTCSRMKRAAQYMHEKGCLLFLSSRCAGLAPNTCMRKAAFS